MHLKRVCFEIGFQNLFLYRFYLWKKKEKKNQFGSRVYGGNCCYQWFCMPDRTTFWYGYQLLWYMGDEQKSFWKDLDKEILGRAPSQVWKFLEIWEGLVLLQDIKEWLVVYDLKTQELRKFSKYGGHSEDSFAVSYTDSSFYKWRGCN